MTNRIRYISLQGYVVHVIVLRMRIKTFMKNVAFAFGIKTKYARNLKKSYNGKEQISTTKEKKNVGNIELENITFSWMFFIGRNTSYETKRMRLS